MSKFPYFISEVNDFKKTLNLESSSDWRSYGWKMSNNIKNDFISHLKESWPDVPSTIENNYNVMFEKEHDLLGIQMLDICPQDKVYLLKATEVKKHITLSNFGCFTFSNICNIHTVTCPVTGKSFYWPMAIKPKSIKIKDKLVRSNMRSEYYDANENNHWGSIIWNIEHYPYNNDVYISGRVNYKTGKFLLERYTPVNEYQYDTLLAQQAGSSSNNNAPAIKFKKDVDTIEIEAIVYENPIKIVWQCDVSQLGG